MSSALLNVSVMEKENFCIVLSLHFFSTKATVVFGEEFICWILQSEGQDSGLKVCSKPFHLEQVEMTG